MMPCFEVQPDPFSKDEESRKRLQAKERGNIGLGNGIHMSEYYGRELICQQVAGPARKVT